MRWTTISSNPKFSFLFIITVPSVFLFLFHFCLLIRERLFDEVGKKIKRETDHKSSHMGRRQLLGPPGTLNTITPCAACKLLRRRCAEECPFSPYFSPHEPHKFAAVHKVFGASNVSKMLMVKPQFPSNLTVFITFYPSDVFFYNLCIYN